MSYRQRYLFAQKQEKELEKAKQERPAWVNPGKVTAARLCYERGHAMHLPMLCTPCYARLCYLNL